MARKIGGPGTRASPRADSRRQAERGAALNTTPENNARSGSPPATTRRGDGDSVDRARPRTHSSGGGLGAIPRPRYYSSSSSTPSPSPREIRRTRRRLDSLNLDPPRQTGIDSEDDHYFHFGMPFYCHHRNAGFADSNLETEMEGQELYLHFFNERLVSEGLVNHVIDSEFRFSQAALNPTTMLNLENFQDPIWRATGRRLKTLADQFASSPERLIVRQRAEQVDISTLDMEKFTAMLSELFQGGCVTRERILVLFFFCSDVAICSIRNGTNGLLAKLTQWSLIFIKDKVCSWVQNNGGWSNVLRSGMSFVQQSVVIVSCAMVISCCVIYLRKNLR